MVSAQGFTIDFTLNDSTLSIENDLYSNFLIHEVIHFGIYFGELILLNISPVFKEYPFINGSKIGIKITFTDNNDILDLKFIIYQIINSTESINILLIPEVYIKLRRDRISKGYNDKVENIVSTIAQDCGITSTEIENTSAPNRKWLQLGQNNFYFLKSLVKDSISNHANFLFFVDKTDKLKFYSIGYLKRKNTIDTIQSSIMKDIVIKDQVMSLQLMSGMGARGFNFDWDEGDITESLYDSTKFQSIPASDKMSKKIGINEEYISSSNNFVMLNPIAKDIYPPKKYNDAELENSVLRKNYFNIFIDFICPGKIAYSPGEKVDISFLKSSGINEEIAPFTGSWVIYSSLHNFPTKGYYTYLSLTNSMYYQVSDNNLY